AEMLGTSCKKIVLQLALQDIGQLTDLGSADVCTSATTVPGARGPLRAGRSVADDGDHGPRAQVDTVAVAQRHDLTRRDVLSVDHDAVPRAGVNDRPALVRAGGQ